MGKIQDKIKRLNGKARPSAALADLLRIPAQQEHENSPLPIDPAGLKTWLVTQGFVNKGFASNGTDNTAASAKSLMRVLQHSNRTIITSAQRLLIMEQYEKPFATAMQTLDTQYLYFDFPLQANAEKSFQLAVTLCQEMAYGYKIALVDSIRGDGVFSREKLGKTKKIQAIKIALEHLSQMALRHSQVYRDWPKGFWRDVNALSGIAMHLGIAESTVSSDKNNTTNKPAIINQYARLCALHIIDQKHYQPEQLRTLFMQLTMHASELIFHHKPQTQSGNQYSVGDDNPPVLNEFRYQKDSDSNLLHFSLDALLGKIDAAEGKNSTSGIHHHCNRRRCESRAPRAGMITAESGLKEIHTLMKLTPPVENTESQFTDIRQLLQPDTAEVAPAQSDTLNSINTTDFGTTFDVIDESSNGFGLKSEDAGSCRLQNGELLAHCYRGKNNETSWHLAVIRWLKTYADNTLQLGVESISCHATAVDVVRLVKGERQVEKPMEALLVNYQPIDSKAKMLILPMHKYMAGETVGYLDHNGFQLVKLIEKVELAGNFQSFAISSVKQLLSGSDTLVVPDDEVAEHNTEYQAAV